MGRRNKTINPTTFNLLKPAAMEHIECETRRTENKRAKVAERHINRRDLKSQVGDTVRMQPIDNTCEWKEATVTQRLKSRTYDVTTGDGRNYRRSQVFLRSTRRNSTSSSHESLHHPATSSSYPFNVPRLCIERASHCAADPSTATQPADASGDPDDPPTTPQNVSATPTYSSPKMTATADKTVTEP